MKSKKKATKSKAKSKQTHKVKSRPINIKLDLPKAHVFKDTEVNVSPYKELAKLKASFGNGDAVLNTSDVVLPFFKKIKTFFKKLFRNKK